MLPFATAALLALTLAGYPQPTEQPKPQSPAAPAPAAPVPAADKPAPAEFPPSPVQPRFIKGQRVVLTQYLSKVERDPREVPGRIDIEVIDATPEKSTLTWAISLAKKPDNFSEAEWTAIKDAIGGERTPVIDLIVDHTAGEVHLKDWQRARDEMLAMTERLVARSMPDADPAVLKKAMETVRAMAATQQGAENMLLRQITPYFACLHHQIEVGEELSDEVTVTIQTTPPQGVPGKRTISMKADKAAPALVCVEYVTQLDREKATATMQDWIREMQKRIRPGDKAFSLDSVDIKNTITMTFDPAKGWPVKAALLSENKISDRTRTDRIRWELVEGPTIPQAPKPAPKTP